MTNALQLFGPENHMVLTYRRYLNIELNYQDLKIILIIDLKLLNIIIYIDYLTGPSGLGASGQKLL